MGTAPSILEIHDGRGIFEKATSCKGNVQMGRRKLNYKNGSYFAVPLRNGGFAMGVVARNDRRGGIFGYFFGPRLSTPEEANPANAVPSRAIYVGEFGDLGLLNKEWIVLGAVPDWKPNDWPMPPLVRVDTHANRAFLSFYDENSFACLREVEIDPKTASNYIEDGAMGYGAMETRLTKLLS